MAGWLSGLIPIEWQLVCDWGLRNARSSWVSAVPLDDVLLGLRSVSLIIVIQSNLVVHISEFSPRTRDERVKTEENRLQGWWDIWGMRQKTFQETSLSVLHKSHCQTRLNVSVSLASEQRFLWLPGWVRRVSSAISLWSYAPAAASASACSCLPIYRTTFELGLWLSITDDETICQNEGQYSSRDNSRIVCGCLEDRPTTRNNGQARTEVLSAGLMAVGWLGFTRCFWSIYLLVKGWRCKSKLNISSFFDSRIQRHSVHRRGVIL